MEVDVRGVIPQDHITDTTSKHKQSTSTIMGLTTAWGSLQMTQTIYCSVSETALDHFIFGRKDLGR